MSGDIGVLRAVVACHLHDCVVDDGLAGEMQWSTLRGLVSFNGAVQ